MTTSALVCVAAAAAAAALLAPPPVAGRSQASDRVAMRVRGGSGTNSRRFATPSLPLSAGLGCGLIVLLLLPHPWGMPVALAAATAAHRWVGTLEPAAVRRRRSRLEAALPHVVDLAAVCLAAGASPSGALSSIAGVVAAPMREELAGFTARLALGADPVEVWRAMGRHAQLGALGRTLVRAAESGAPVSDALVRLSTELRGQRRAAMESAARGVEVKAALPLGLCLLPAFVLIGIVPMVAGSFSLTFLG